MRFFKFIFFLLVLCLFLLLLFSSCESKRLQRPISKQEVPFLSEKEYEIAINAYAKPVKIGSRIPGGNYIDFVFGTRCAYLDIDKQEIISFMNPGWATRRLPDNLHTVWYLIWDGKRLLYISERGKNYFFGVLGKGDFREIKLPFKWIKGAGDDIEIFVMKEGKYVVFCSEWRVGKNVLLIENDKVIKGVDNNGYQIDGVTKDKVFLSVETDDYYDKEYPPAVVWDSSLNNLGRAPDVLHPEEMRGGSYTEAKKGSKKLILIPYEIDASGYFYLITCPENRKGETFFWRLDSSYKPVARLSIPKDSVDIADIFWAPNGDAYYEIYKGKTAIIYLSKYKGP